MARRWIRIASAFAVVIALSGCTESASPVEESSPPADAQVSSPSSEGPREPFVDASPSAATIVDGDDWSLPASSLPAANSGFFSEEAAPAVDIGVRSVDVTWRQLRPTSAASIDRAATGTAQDMELAGLDEQLAEPGDFWMRLFASGADWAPEWVAEDCGVTSYGPDEDGERHLPIWNECVWGHLMDTYRLVFADLGLAADPRLRFVFVPGAFDWAEYDYDVIGDAVRAGDLTEEDYLAWYAHAWTDLVTIFGDDADKLVFTGEDYPWGPFGSADDLLARAAVDAGMGIRNGITELSNFHLSEAPAYGAHIQPDGHVTIDDTLAVHSGRFIVAAENECFDDCGYTVDDPYYAVRQANLKALQLRVNWLYVVDDSSYLREYPEHWDWVRLSLGQTAETSTDAWAALRDAEDTFWTDEAGPFSEPGSWDTRPWVRNVERFLVQVDEPGSVAHRSEADVHTGEVAEENGTAHEGLTTQVASGDTGFVFEVDPRFAAGTAERDVLKITFLDEGGGSFSVQTATGASAEVPRGGTGKWRTATVSLPEGALSGGGAPRLRIALADGADDLAVRFVRLVHVD